MDDSIQRLLYKIATTLGSITPGPGSCSMLSGAGSPIGSVVPEFVGQLFHDTVANVYYRATGLTVSDWVLISGGVVCSAQSGAGSPAGMATPAFVGQLYHDTTNDEYWRSTGLTNADWVFTGFGDPFVEWLPHTEIATWNDANGDAQTGDYPAFLATADLGSLSFCGLGGTAITSLICRNVRTLTRIVCDSCTGPLTALEVENCESLVELSCAFNSIVSLDVTSCLALRDLNCFYNALTSLGISNLTALSSVQCGYNSLASLNVSGCDRLAILTCHNNSLTTLDVSNLKELASLICAYNAITSLNVLGCPVLNSVLSDNNSMNPGAVDTVLCDLVTNAFSPGTVSLTNNSTPTAAGVACGATLTGNGWTVSYDP